MLRVCLNNHRIWGHLAGMSPPAPTRPEEPTAGADGVPPSTEVMNAYAQAVEHYMVDLADYDAWLVDEARVTQILLGSMKVEFAMDLSNLPPLMRCGSRHRLSTNRAALLSTSPPWSLLALFVSRTPPLMSSTAS
jgi:hypothetical protein